jgi:hypothetical protein
MLLKAQAQASYVAGFTKTASVLLPLAKIWQKQARERERLKAACSARVSKRTLR